MFCSLFFFSSRRRHTRCSRDWSSDVCSSDLVQIYDAAASNVFYNPVSHRLPMPAPAVASSPQPVGKPLAFGSSIGAIFFLGLLLARSLIIRHSLLRHGSPAARLVIEILEACRAALRLRYPIRITASDQIAAPALTGLIPARLIVPTTFTTP